MKENNYHFPVVSLITFFVVLLAGCDHEPENQNYITGIEIKNLRTNYVRSPLGIDKQKPLLSWEIVSERRGVMQTACQILVASDSLLLTPAMANVWNSGKMKISSSVGVQYEGPVLSPKTCYFWKVLVWTNQERKPGESEPSWWETGLMENKNWQATWIGDGREVPKKEEDFYKEIPVPLFRKKFTIDNPVESARLYIVGLGYYVSYLNGQKIGDEVLSPSWTQFSKRIKYQVFDVTHQIKKGENLLGVMLGNGWYNPLPMSLFGRFNLREYLTIGKPGLISQLDIRYQNGQHEIIVSDTTWKTGTGDIVKNNVYLGDWIDFRKSTDWINPSFEDSAWEHAVTVPEPHGKLEAQLAPPVRITREIIPIRISEPVRGVYVYDFGQNFAGWVRFKLHGEKGKMVLLRYGELLFPNGRVNGLTTVAGQIKKETTFPDGQGAPSTAWQEDGCYLSGNPEDVFRQSFTFHGFRYVEIRGLDYKPSISDINGLRLNADLERNGTFSCSDSLFNRIHRMVEWTFLSNVFSIESDCPGREKFGYGGDMVAAGEAYMLNFDMAGFYRKTIDDLNDDARENGGITETAPYNGIADKGLGGGSGPMGWQLAFPFLQKKMVQYYGDRNLPGRYYAATKKMVEFMIHVAGDSLIEFGIGDHNPVDRRPTSFTSAAFYYHCVRLIADFAKALSKEQEANRYGRKAEQIKEMINKKFLDVKTGGYTPIPIETTQALALYYDFPPDLLKMKTLEVLKQNILEDHNGHISAGIFGTKMLLEMLGKYDRGDLAYTMVHKTSFPGWGYMLDNGATTLWEEWQGGNNYPSHNHPMFGSVDEWFFRSVLGINPDEDAIGFDKIILCPVVTDSLEWAEGSYHSVRGRISSSWRHLEGVFEWDVAIPPNSMARVFIPLLKNNPEVRESNNILYRNEKFLYKKGDIKFTGRQGEKLELKLGSGEYHFSVKNGI